MAPSVVEMFAGAGGAALGLHKAGFFSLAAIEYWDEAARVLRKAGFPVIEGRVEEPSVIAEVTRRLSETKRTLDLLWASPPCQPYSAAGLRLGKLDPRDGWGATLLYVQNFRPRAVLIENVTGAPVEEWADALRASYAHVGAFRLLSRDFGVPNDRPRAFVYAGPSTLASYLAVVNRHRAPPRSVESVLPHLKGYYVRAEQISARARSTSEVCPTLTTKGNLYVHKRNVGVREKGYKTDREISRRLSVPEQIALQGFPPDWPFPSATGATYKMTGNAVAPALARALGLGIVTVLR